jgi:two-component system, cell cycle sensor histidine kinase and response regulator CckA
MEQDAVGRAVEAILAEARQQQTPGAAVIATDIDGKILFWNDSAVELYGWSSNEVLGKNILTVMPTYNSAEEAAEIMERLRRGRKWSGRFIVKHRDGSPMVADVSDIPVRLENKTIGVVGVSRREQRQKPR